QPAVLAGHLLAGMKAAAGLDAQLEVLVVVAIQAFRVGQLLARGVAAAALVLALERCVRCAQGSRRLLEEALRPCPNRRPEKDDGENGQAESAHRLYLNARTT